MLSLDYDTRCLSYPILSRRPSTCTPRAHMHTACTHRLLRKALHSRIWPSGWEALASEPNHDSIPVPTFPSRSAIFFSVSSAALLIAAPGFVAPPLMPFRKLPQAPCCPSHRPSLLLQLFFLRLLLLLPLPLRVCFLTWSLLQQLLVGNLRKACISQRVFCHPGKVALMRPSSTRSRKSQVMAQC